MNRKKGIERRFIPLFYSCNIEAIRIEGVVGKNSEIAAVDYNVPLAVVLKNTQIFTHFFNPFTSTY